MTMENYFINIKTLSQGSKVQNNKKDNKYNLSND